ncbi:MAG: 4-hydroxybenzoate solanesyltransferase [Cyanobacteria bacterium P01_A01_bin.37]
MTAESNLKREPTWRTIVRLLRWNKPAGRLILMIPALWAVYLGAHSIEEGQWPPLPLVGVIILGTLATSAAGCVINDLWDRNIDPNVERTRQRPLASRALTVKTGIVVMLVAFACAGGLALYLNPLSFGLCVAAVPFIVLYPLAKRVFPLPQLVLSLNWGFAVLISWTAVTGTLGIAAWFLWAAVVSWTMGFDTVYAMADREDDKKLGVNSSALFFGDRAADAVGLFFMGAAVLLSLTGMVLKLNIIFPIAMAIAIAGWALQYMDLRPKRPHQSTYGRIFSQNVWIGFLILAGMILGTR